MAGSQPYLQSVSPRSLGESDWQPLEVGVLRERAAALGLDQRQAWRLNTELSCQRPSGLKLAQAVEIGVQGNRIAAGVGRGEIRPDAAAQVDLEASRIAVVARRIAANVLTRLDATAGNPFLQDGREVARVQRG